MEEIIVNIHMHTRYSDGEGSHADIGQAALRAGIDAVIVTDHNILVHGMEGYYEKDRRRVLMLVGEEIHDRTRVPQKNHLLVIGASRELAAFAPRPQQLLDQARQAEALTFIAHPFDPAMPAFDQDDISWEDWSVDGFTGIELWNGFSEFKAVAHSKLAGLFYVFFPRLLNRGPLPQTLKLWNDLTAGGKHIVAIGGSDAHSYHKSAGPLRRVVFPYEFHFNGVNNHLLLPEALNGNLAHDRRLVLAALSQGHNFIGYDLPAPTRGFRFTARGRDVTANMGDEIPLQDGVTFQLRLPGECEARLLRDGAAVKTWHSKDICTHIANQPGVYRVECHINYLGRNRGWIFTNPIYVR